MSDGTPLPLHPLPVPAPHCSRHSNCTLTHLRLPVPADTRTALYAPSLARACSSLFVPQRPNFSWDKNTRERERDFGVFGATPRARFEGGDWSSSRPRRTPRPRFNFDGMEAVLQKVHGGGLGGG